MALPLRVATAKEPHHLRQCQHLPLVRSLWAQTYQPLSAFFFFTRLDPNFFLAHRTSGWQGRKKECHAQGEKAAKLTVLFINPLHVAISNIHMRKKNQRGVKHYTCTPCLAPNPKRKSLIEKEKDLAFSQEVTAMQGEAQ